MTTFSRDVDLLKWEPVLFRNLAFPSQMLCQGIDGVTSGTRFTSGSGAFVERGVKAGQVIYLYNSAIDSCYEITAVVSATELTVSVVRGNAEQEPIAVPGGSNLQYRISTFDPQAEEAGEEMLRYFGIDIGSSEEQIRSEMILDGGVLRQASVFSILSAVYASQAGGAEDETGYWLKSQRYQKLYQASRAGARITLDTDGNLLVNEVRGGGSLRMLRF